LQISINISSHSIKEESVGFLNYSLFLDNIEGGNDKFINLDFEPRDLCILPNNCILVTSSKSKNITIYDSSFKLLKIIDQIDDQYLTPLSTTTNGKNSIFITQDDPLSQIIKTDLEFKLIKIFNVQNNDKFAIPIKLVYNEDSIYVCDCHNSRIQELNEDLMPINSYMLNFKPWKIKIIKNIACIRPVGETFVAFYNLKPFYFKTKVFDVTGDILTFNSWFYLFNFNEKMFNCFDINGLCVEESKINIKDEISFDSIDNFNNKLIIAITQEKKLAILN
jgi:hypothetical protein